jgi:Flp pilus assembly protein TadG
MMLRRTKARRGAVLAESALIYPVLFLLMLGIVLLGISVFRYQQVAHASREASRWASVHGEKYGQENNTTAATPEEIFNNAIAPQAAGMPTQGMLVTVTQNVVTGTVTYSGTNGGLTYSVTWNMNADGTPDKRPTRVITVIDPVTGLTEARSQSNTVSVTVTYSWNTGLFGTIPVSSTSVNTIFY